MNYNVVNMLMFFCIFAGIGTLIQSGFWEFDFASKDFSLEHMKHAWNPRPGEVMHERDSDNCLTELFGTG